MMSKIIYLSILAQGKQLLLFTFKTIRRDGCVSTGCWGNTEFCFFSNKRLQIYFLKKTELELLRLAVYKQKEKKKNKTLSFP